MLKMSSTSLAQQISLFRIRVQDRSFDDGTVRILESILVSKDVESLIGIRSALKQFVRDESLLIIREISEESTEIKLLCADFLVHVFALIGDIESCLALRYEALVMREQKAVTYPTLEVSPTEWLTFAQQCLSNGFYSITDKACEKAVVSSEANHGAGPEAEDFVQDVHVIEKIKRLKDTAVRSISACSVQAQASSYMKHKKVDTPIQLTTSCETQSSGSSLFRNGIKKHNLRRLHETQQRL